MPRIFFFFSCPEKGVGGGGEKKLNKTNLMVRQGERWGLTELMNLGGVTNIVAKIKKSLGWVYCMYMPGAYIIVWCHVMPKYVLLEPSPDFSTSIPPLEH